MKKLKFLLCIYVSKLIIFIVTEFIKFIGSHMLSVWLDIVRVNDRLLNKVLFVRVNV